MRAQVREAEDQYASVRQEQRQFLIKIKSLLRTELDLLDEDGVRQALGDIPDTSAAITNAPVTEDTIVMTPRSQHRAEGEVIRDARVLAEQRREQTNAEPAGES